MPIEIVKSENPLLLTTAPWGVLYGEHGCRVFKTRRAAERWVDETRHPLERGLCPETGRPS